ncbi:IS66-like element accessory protein TnpA [Hansschlegelia beijingensis]
MTWSRVEVITSVERRRRWSREDKERLVAASFEPGVSSSEVARAAGIHVSQLFRWRKDLCNRIEPPVTQFLPVVMEPEPPSSASPEGRAPAPRRGRPRRRGIIEIELVGGKRVRVDGDVDVETLRRVLDVLGPR